MQPGRRGMPRGRGGRLRAIQAYYLSVLRPAHTRFRLCFLPFLCQAQAIFLEPLDERKTHNKGKGRVNSSCIRL